MGELRDWSKTQSSYENTFLETAGDTNYWEGGIL